MTRIQKTPSNTPSARPAAPARARTEPAKAPRPGFDPTSALDERTRAPLVLDAAPPPPKSPVERWQAFCEAFRPGAEASLASKRTLPFPDRHVQDLVRTGKASPVYVGGASHFPGSENLPVFFQEFRKGGELVQLYSYQRRNGEFASFDVSGDLARAYGDARFTDGNAGTNSVLGLPTSGHQYVVPGDTSDWHVTAFRGTPEVQELLRRGGFGYQEFEGGILVELGGGRIQAFRFDPADGAFKAMGQPFPGGSITDGGFPPVRALPGAVSVQAGHFQVDGAPFKHVGTNLSQTVYEHPDRIWDELSQLKAAGVQNVRVFLPNSALTPRQVGDRLQTLLDLAAAQGMKVTVSLTHFARQEFYTSTAPQFMGGHNGADARDFGGPFECVAGDERFHDWLRDASGNLVIGHPVLTNAWFQGGFRQNYKPFAEAIVDRFKDNPAVFAWEVANEAKSYFPPPDTGAVQSFYEEMVQAIRARDPHHLVSAGLTNSTEYVGADPEARRRFLRLFDFVEVHQYSDQGVALTATQVEADVRLARELGKPVVLGEFGFFDHADGGYVPTEAQVRAYVNRAVNEWGVDAVMPWAAAARPGSEAWWQRFGVDRLHAILRDARASCDRFNAAPT